MAIQYVPKGSAPAGRQVATKGARMTAAQAAADLPPVGRDAPVKVMVRMTEAEGAHLDEIRGRFSRVDALRLLLQAAQRLGV